MRLIQNLFNSLGTIHWALLALAAGVLLVFAVVVGRAILTIMTLD